MSKAIDLLRFSDATMTEFAAFAVHPSDPTTAEFTPIAWLFVEA